MFARKERIPSPILKTMRGTRSKSPYFGLHFAPNTSSGNRFAVVIGKKVDPRASRRHTLKRRAAAILREFPPGGMDVVLTILPAANTLSREYFAKELRALLSILDPRP